MGVARLDSFIYFVGTTQKVGVGCNLSRLVCPFIIFHVLSVVVGHNELITKSLQWPINPSLLFTSTTFSFSSSYYGKMYQSTINSYFQPHILDLYVSFDNYIFTYLTINSNGGGGQWRSNLRSLDYRTI